MEDEELMRQKEAPEFYEDTIEYQNEMKGEGYENMYQPPDEDEKSTNSKESEEE